MKLVIICCSLLLVLLLEANALECYDCTGSKSELNPHQNDTEPVKCQNPDKTLSKPCPDPNNYLHKDKDTKYYCAVKFVDGQAFARRCFPHKYRDWNDKSECHGTPGDQLCMCETDHCNDNRHKN